MPRGRSKRGREIRSFVLRHVAEHPRDLVKLTGEKFEISRQAARRYVSELVGEGMIEAHGAKRQRRYALKVLDQRLVSLKLKGLEEDVVWRQEIEGVMRGLPQNVFEMWHYACTEMINNAIDHSDGRVLTISLKKNPVTTNVAILDDGTGIFRKIKEACHLEDERHSVLELAKGKLTTDPAHHTGEGIFFTSRIMDDFRILSGDVFFSHRFGKVEDWILEVEQPESGTAVFLGLDNESKRTTGEVFASFASDPEDYGFTKTIVPVRMARHGAENLVSRSQAKRLLGRLDRFSTVILDFEYVDTIGRAFADEIFRVFVNAHPNVLLIPVKANEEVERVISAARKQSLEEENR